MASAHRLPDRKRTLMELLFGVRRDDDAEQRDDDDLEAAREAKRQAEALEQRTQQRIKSARRSSDTGVRRVTKNSKHISDVLRPVDGKSVAELAAEELERAEREAAAS